MFTLLDDVDDLLKQSNELKKNTLLNEKSFKDCIQKLEEDKSKLTEIARSKYTALNDQINHLFEQSSIDLSKFLNDNWGAIIESNGALMGKREKENEELNIRLERYIRSVTNLEAQYAELKVKHCNLESKYNFISNTSLSNKFHKNLKHKYERAMEDLDADKELIEGLKKQIEGLAKETQSIQISYSNQNKEIRTLRDQLFKELQGKEIFFINVEKLADERKLLQHTERERIKGKIRVRIPYH